MKKCKKRFSLKNLSYYLRFSNYGHRRGYTPKKIPPLVCLRNAVKYEKGFLSTVSPWDKAHLAKDLKDLFQRGARKSVRKTAHETYLALVA